MKTFTIASMMILGLSACSTVMTTSLKTPYEQKRENMNYMADANTIYRSYADLIAQQKGHCVQSKDNWEWDKIMLNQRTFVLERNIDRKPTRTFANLLCVDQMRTEEKILRITHWLTDVSSSQEAREGIDKRGVLPIKVSIFNQDGSELKTSGTKTLLTSSTQDWFVDLSQAPATSFYVVLEVDQALNPDKPLNVKSILDGNETAEYSVFPISSGLLKAKWTSAKSQSFQRSHSL